MTLLDIQDLSVEFDTPDGVVRAVQDSSFTVESGKTLAVVGESGSGKSVTMQSILGLVRGARVTGRAFFGGLDLLALSVEQLRRIRGAEIGMIFQDPLTSLHPHYRVGAQMAEAIRAHEEMPKRAALDRATELLGMVGIPQPALRVNDYPHQLSGGMRQRVMTAMAIALEPALLIADEPTTALDVTVQAQILELLTRLQDELGMAIIVITHDLGVVAGIADTVMVMYAGRPVETAGIQTIYDRGHHPYTRGLLGSIPKPGKNQPLTPIPGQPPSLITVPLGCAFHPRCSSATNRCRLDRPPLMPVDGPGSRHESACWLPRSGAWPRAGASAAAWEPFAPPVSPSPGEGVQ